VEIARLEDASDLGIARVERARRLVVAVRGRPRAAAVREIADLDAVARVAVAAELVLRLVEAAVRLLEADVGRAVDLVRAGIGAGDAGARLTALDAVAVTTVV